ncbi:MAG: NUDIX domain-containing protein [Bdellovibrionales bacterium]|nr:NUDIX domain-containing protein [Bdellovibrionales bacterium]
MPLRPNVCMLVFNENHDLFLGERRGEPGVWQFPQGGVESDYSLEENVLRELEEELGVPRTHFKIVKRLNAQHSYEFDNPPTYAVGKWRGQTQSFWLVRFIGTDNLITLGGESPEFMAWRWCSTDQVRRLAEPKRVPGYEAPLAEVEQLWRRP